MTTGGSKGSAPVSIPDAYTAFIQQGQLVSDDVQEGLRISGLTGSWPYNRQMGGAQSAAHPGGQVQDGGGQAEDAMLLRVLAMEALDAITTDAQGHRHHPAAAAVTLHHHRICAQKLPQL